MIARTMPTLSLELSPNRDVYAFVLIRTNSIQAFSWVMRLSGYYLEWVHGDILDSGSYCVYNLDDSPALYRMQSNMP